MNKTLSVLGILAMAGLGSNQAWGAKFPPVAGNGIQPSSNFFLCQSDHTGQTQIYSCHDYRRGNQRLRAYFNGGTIPRAVAMLDAEGHVSAIQLPGQLADIPVRAPRQIPATAKFQGSGVCLDEHDRNVPCGIFVNKPARMPEITRYLVYYDAGGDGVIQFEKQVAGPNRDAIPAELAYQIGVRLMDSDCCRAEGLGYLKLALSLFPDSRVYRKTFDRYRVELAALKTDD